MTEKKSLFRSFLDYMMSPPSSYNVDGPEPLSAAPGDRVATNIHQHVEASPAPLYMRGGADEPYCSEECYSNGGRAVYAVSLGDQQSGAGKCMTCGIPTHSGPRREDAMAVPIRGLIGLFCQQCVERKKADTFINSMQECAWCGKPIIPDNHNPTPPVNAGDTSWEIIGGDEAVHLADEANMAPRGSFTACALRWKKNGEPPFIVTTTGTVKCRYCAATTPFTMDAMGHTVPCSGCSNTYNLFSMSHTKAPFIGRIVTASVLSHEIGTPIIPPDINISNASES